MVSSGVPSASLNTNFLACDDLLAHLYRRLPCHVRDEPLLVCVWVVHCHNIPVPTTNTDLGDNTCHGARDSCLCFVVLVDECKVVRTNRGIINKVFTKHFPDRGHNLHRPVRANYGLPPTPGWVKDVPLSVLLHTRFGHTCEPTTNQPRPERTTWSFVAHGCASRLWGRTPPSHGHLTNGG